MSEAWGLAAPSPGTRPLQKGTHQEEIGGAQGPQNCLWPWAGPGRLPETAVYRDESLSGWLSPWGWRAPASPRQAPLPPGSPPRRPAAAGAQLLRISAGDRREWGCPTHSDSRRHLGWRVRKFNGSGFPSCGHVASLSAASKMERQG